MHTHWRWAKAVEQYYGGHFGNGKLLLPADTTQDMSIGIVRNRVGEERPNDFLDLIQGSFEPIRSRIPAGISAHRTVDHYKYTVPEDVVYWLLAKGKKNSDKFFSHYSFFDPNSPNQERTITSTSQPLTGGDRPSTISYAYLFDDGPATYNEIDPNTVAQLPGGYAHYNQTSYEVHTEAEVSGPHTVTFDLPSVTSQTTFDNLRVLHAEPDPYDSSQTIWVDRTILPPDSPAPNFTARTIYAKVNEVGPFIVASYTAPSPNTNVADLSASISDSADPVTAGNQITYTVTVTNNGPNSATDVILSNGLSPDVIFESVSSPQGICREEESTVMCKLGTVASGASLNVTIVATVYEGQTRFQSGGKGVSNAAFVIANEGDPNETNNSDTEGTNALPQTVAPPNVEIQVPTNETILKGPATFDAVVKANCNGPDGCSPISNVELLMNGDIVGNCSDFPPGSIFCNVGLNNMTVGEYSFIAVATNAGGRKAVSDPASVIVNGPANILLGAPLGGTVLARQTSISLTATATNPSGTISQVEFIADGLSIGNGVSSGTDQYSFAWNNASTGVHVLRAIATDGNGVKSYSYPTRINVTTPPSVNITSPGEGSWYPGQSNITFTANASDFDDYVSKVEFVADGTMLMGTATVTSQDTYSLTWNSASAGARSITAKVTDGAGYVVTSAPINITVTDPVPPSDLAVWRPSNGTWYVIGSSGNISQSTWGQVGDRPVQGDYDGDGTTDFSIFRPSTGQWYVVNSSDSSWSIWNWGVSSDLTAPADYDGDGKTDPAIFRPGTSEWFIQGSSAGYSVVTWGVPGDVPASADFDGDGKADIAVLRGGNTFLYISSLNASLNTFAFPSQSGDKPVGSDYDGDGRADLAIYNSTTGYWYIRQSTNGVIVPVAWGEAGDIEVHNDYDGDGRVDYAVWRPSNGTWYIRHFGTDNYRITAWGESGDTPVPAFYNR